MDAPELLHHLRDAGLVLTLTPAGGLHVAPRKALTEDLRVAIRAQRDALVLALLSAYDDRADHEAFEKRAAIMEFDGVLTHSDAEVAARELLADCRVSARVALACPSCQHFTRRKTCTEPVAAGLLTAAQGFGIVWPDVEHATQCVAFNAKLPKGAKSTRFEQANGGDESGNAIRMDDDERTIFLARADQFTRMGRVDAEALAEKLTRRDRERDDRRLCLECTWLGDSGRCLAAATGRISGADRRLEPVQTILRQCGAFGLRKGLT